MFNLKRNNSQKGSERKGSGSIIRTLSVRSKKEGSSSSHSHFSFATLRGAAQPELSKKLFKLIKSQNHVVSAYETAGKERLSVATQLADWGSGTNDDSITEISDKVAVILSELGEQEDNYAHSIDDSRSVLKSIRDTEKSVQPTRDGKQKLMDKIQHLKSKEPESAQLVILEQELVRAEAENLVAEAQLTNVTRLKMKEAYAKEFAATIERAERQIILARHGRRLLNLLDDAPVVPGVTRPEFELRDQARQIINDAEDDLHDYQPEMEPVYTAADATGANLLPQAHEEREDVAIGESASTAGTAGVEEPIPGGYESSIGAMTAYSQEQGAVGTDHGRLPVVG